MSSILSVGQSALNAAQVGLATTGHNIANASTPGYSRQVVMQGAVAGQDNGFGFVGKGTEVTSVQRVYSEFLATQVTSAQTDKGRLDAYYTQVKRIDALMADPEVGLSPALQGFFKDVQNLAADPNGAAARGSLISSANVLTAGFQTVEGQLAEISEGVNGEITTSITSINTYARQIAQLNESIEKATANAQGKPPNDLLDQRDYLITQLAKEIKVSVVSQNNNYNVFIGKGQPLVVGAKTMTLFPMASPTDQSRMEIGYTSNGKTTMLAEESITGGRLGGLFEFRSGTLDSAQNAFGRMAIGLAATFNEQHRLGQTQTGAMGGDFFSVGAPVVTSSSLNTGTGKASATIVDAGLLTASDYRVQYDGSNYNVTRLSDGAVTTFAAFPRTIDGVQFDLTGAPAVSDTFLVRPTAAGAAGIQVIVGDKTNIAAAAPVATSAPSTNTGTGKISAGSVSSAFTPASVTPAVTLSFGAGNTITGFPAVPVTVTQNGVDTVYAAGAPVTYAAGATISFGGVQVAISGVPLAGDTFSIGRNGTGSGDSRNAVLLGSLQGKNTMDGKTTSYQGAYAQLVSMVGNKTREMEVTSAAAGKLYNQALTAQQSESGVNLDEEAANLVRYQQAYQAAGKVMQTASDLFQVLLQLGQ